MSLAPAGPSGCADGAPVPGAAAGNADMMWIAPAKLREALSALFQAHGLPEDAAGLVADTLVDADMAGVASHGALLVPLYLARLQAGSVPRDGRPVVVRDTGSTAVMDAGHAFGQLSADHAVRWLQERCPEHGLAAVAVRNAFHFGAAGYWAQRLAESGLIGIAMSNTRPLMPAPGGAQRIVGNNPLAIAMPSATEVPIVLDMALSAGAMGKIRLAADQGGRLPEGWAVDAAGAPTQEPAQAIKGMLLPAGGAKGFGLAFMIDLFCGGLSSGAMGGEVRRLYDELEAPYGCAQFFLAIDVARFLPLEQFRARASAFAQAVRDSGRAPGVAQVYSPGARSWARRQAHRIRCPIAAETADRLMTLCTDAGLSRPSFHPHSSETPS